MIQSQKYSNTLVFTLCFFLNEEFYLMISTYSRSLPLLSLHLRYMTEASTLAGEKVLGSFSSEITLSKMVLDNTANN